MPTRPRPSDIDLRELTIVEALRRVENAQIIAHDQTRPKAGRIELAKRELRKAKELFEAVDGLYDLKRCEAYVHELSAQEVSEEERKRSFQSEEYRRAAQTYLDAAESTTTVAEMEWALRSAKRCGARANRLEGEPAVTGDIDFRIQPGSFSGIKIGESGDKIFALLGKPDEISGDYFSFKKLGIGGAIVKDRLWCLNFYYLSKDYEPFGGGN